MKNYENTGSSAETNDQDRENTEEVVDTESYAHVYPYNNIPTEARATLERCFSISDVDHYDQANVGEMEQRVKLSDINQQQRMIRNYCGDELASSAYVAAALGTVEDINDGLAENRNIGVVSGGVPLSHFFADGKAPDEVYDSENIYIAGLLQDRRRLDLYYKSIMTEGQSRHDCYYRPKQEEWLSDPQLVTPDVLYGMVNDINVESMLISGVEMLRWLQSHQDDNRKTFDRVLYSEKFIAPVAEVIGYDTLAMSLNGLSKKVRLNYGGRGDLIMRADAILERFQDFDGNHSVAHNAQTAFCDITKQLFGDDNIDPKPNLPVSYNDGNDSVYGDTAPTMVRADGQPIDVSWRFRLKTSGSLAWKMYQRECEGGSNEHIPMDILGITAVVKDEADQQALFNAMVKGLCRDDNQLVPYPSPSRTSAIHLRGTDDFINWMARGIDIDPSQLDLHQVGSPEALHLGKITGFYRNLPFELQCVTREYRDSMQTGQLAHIIYKNNGNGLIKSEDRLQWAKLLADIRRRRLRIGKPMLIGSFPEDQNGDGITDRPCIGRSERDAIRFISDLMQSRSIVTRTIGTIALPPVVGDIVWLDDRVKHMYGAEEAYRRRRGDTSGRGNS